MSLQEFYDYDITPENSTLKPREYYKDKPKIMNAFVTDGKFDDKKFEDFYQGALAMYNVYSNEQFNKQLADNSIQYDPFDIYAPQGGKIRDISPRISFDDNQGLGRSITNINSFTSAPLKSPRSIAQGEQIFD